MRDDVKACVDARLQFFETYMQVPRALEATHGEFCQRIQALGEQSPDAAWFEQQFQTQGLAQLFNNLVSRCTPTAVAPTTEQKQASRKMAWDMHRDNIVKDVEGEFLDDVQMKVESDTIAALRQNMINQGTYDDYTRATNAVDDVQRIGGFLGRLFGKKR